MLNVVGTALSFVGWAGIGSGALLFAQCLTICTGVASVAIAARRPTGMSTRTTAVMFSMNVVPVYLMLWISHASLARLGQFWVPFQPHELSAMTVAILAPPIGWVGWVGILLFPLSAALQYFTFTPEQLAFIPARPLIAPVAFASFAAVIFVFRRRERRLSEFASQAYARSEGLRRLTRAMLAIKDMANTPIQAIELDAVTLKHKIPEASEITGRIAVSAARLQQLNRIVDQHIHAGMREADVESFDSRSLLDSAESTD